MAKTLRQRPHETIIVMGVSGCGKSTVGALIADRMGARFLDGDDFHPPANIERMSKALPLTDEDRVEWLAELCTQITQHDSNRGPLIIACSALKRCYRDQLRQAPSNLTFILLHGPRSLIEARLQKRSQEDHHFMPTSLLDSQLAALEDLEGEPNSWTIGIDESPDTIASKIVDLLCS